MSRGGARKNAGRKPKYIDVCETVTFKCPIAAREKIECLIKKELDKWKIKK